QQKLDGSSAMLEARPGAVHRACVRLEEAGILDAIVTQNVDGLHTEAGSSPHKVIEVHGTGREASCLDCGVRQPIRGPLDEFQETGLPPRCAACDGLVKPATISFGQGLNPMIIQSAFAAADSCDLVVALGTTLSVYPAADVSLQAARRGVPYAVVNQGPTDHDGSGAVTLRIDGEVGAVFGSAVGMAIGE
ncbi:MAG: SIR2 family NAD-dependent protein deacylase, partial [Acidimicrobiia bacterium]